MCTLTLAWQVFDDAPVAVAANRDEAFDRPSSPPGVFRAEPLVIAPRDGTAGGTWIGANEFGVFVGLTNRWTDANLAGERSRGLLVADLLHAPSANAAADRLERAVARHEYDGFNLVVADAETAVCYAWDGALSQVAFDPGVHVVVNVAVDDEADVPDERATVGQRQVENAHAVRAELTAGPDETVDAWLDRAASVLADHAYGVCVHGDGFGTRSSSLLALGEGFGGADRRREGIRYRFADGPPCTTAYELLTVEGHL